MPDVRTVEFNSLPKSVRTRFVAITIGTGGPAPLLADRAPVKTKIFGMSFLAALLAILALAMVMAGIGDLADIGIHDPLHVLFGYFPLADKTLIAQIGPATGDATVLRELTHGPLTTSAWAFSFWAGDFWFYTATDKGTSRVARLKTATDGSYDVAIPDTHIRIVGAGVSTCAPRAPVK